MVSAGQCDIYAHVNRIRNPLRFNANEMPQFTRYIENAYRNDIAVL